MHVRDGMLLSQARGICAELLYKDYDETLYFSYQKVLVAELVSCSPRVSSRQVGEIILDAEGLLHQGGESKFARELLKVVSSKGYTDAIVGIANSAYAACVAARHTKRRWTIVPKGYDKQFLSQVPVKHLPLGIETLEMLTTLGIKTIGQFTKLEIDEIRHRFGSEAERAYELGLGIDKSRPMLPLVEKNFQCILDLGGPVESLTDTIFVLKSLLRRLILNLIAEGLCAEEITVYFFSDDTLIEERPIRLVKPSNNTKFLLEVLRLSLESKPLAREFTALKLVVSKAVGESWQQLNLVDSKKQAQLFKQTELGRDEFSNGFAFLLQRVQTRLGESAVVKPAYQDHYFPELSGSWQPVVAESRSIEADTANNYAFSLLKDKGVASGLVVKKFPEPQPALVEINGSKPVALTYRGYWYKVMAITSPDRLSGLWWEAPINKSYYTVMVSSTRLKVEMLMLTYDHETRSWFVEGAFD